MNLVVLAALASVPSSPVGSGGGNFECQLVLSADLAGVERWDGTNVPHFEIAGTERVVRGQHLLVYPFFLGFARDEAGAGEVEYDLRILRPDGKVYHEAEGLKAILGDTRGKDLVLAMELTGVSFDPEDGFGSYRVELLAHDRAGKASARATQTIELVAYEEGESFSDAEEVWAWLWNYHHDPEPCRAAPALRVLASRGLAEITATHGALAELFEVNGWLFPVLFEHSGAETPETRELLLWMLARTSHDPAPYVADLKQAERAAWKRLESSPNPSEDPLRGREDMNELLGRYVLGRSRTPLLRLVLALSPEPGEVVADTTIREPTQGVDVPLSRVMSRAVALSLSRYLTDPTTRGYLEVLVGDESLPSEVRASLERVLAPPEDGERAK